MANPDGFFTSEQIAEQIHLSRITIRRYMNYMVDTGEIISTIDYKTGERPSIIINRHFLRLRTDLIRRSLLFRAWRTKVIFLVTILT